MTPAGALADAYSSVGRAWAGGPARIYRRLADLLVAASPVPMDGASVLDLGAGTGVGSAAAAACGGRVVAVDFAFGMLQLDRPQRPPAVVGDMRALPFAAASFDVALAPFSLNHLVDPSVGVAEAARVLRPGGVLLATTYTADDAHPAKAAVDQALAEAGWRPPGWYADVKATMAALGSVALARAAIERGGMDPQFVDRREVAFPELDVLDIVGWRLGMAHIAPFVATLPAGRREALVARSRALLGEPVAPLVRSILLIGAA